MRSKRSPALALPVAVVLAACGGDDGGSPGDGDAATIDGEQGPPDARTDAGPGVEVPGSLRVYGTGGGIDRAEIAIDPPVPADVGAGDFTIDLWVRLAPRNNIGNPPPRPLPTGCMSIADGWHAGEIILDRSQAGTADRGDLGVAVFAGGVAIGVRQGTTGTTVCGTRAINDAGWHHLAFTRSAQTGIIQLFVDGNPDGMNQGPTGDLSYRDGATGQPKDPFLVLGADKTDATMGRQSMNGWIDELRLSTSVRYTAMFTPATAPHAVDAQTAALYHFDDGDGNALRDAVGTSPGQLRVGTDVNGSTVPVWATAEPFIR